MNQVLYIIHKTLLDSINCQFAPFPCLNEKIQNPLLLAYEIKNLETQISVKGNAFVYLSTHRLFLIVSSAHKLFRVYELLYLNAKLCEFKIPVFEDAHIKVSGLISSDSKDYDNFVSDIKLYFGNESYVMAQFYTYATSMINRKLYFRRLCPSKKFNTLEDQVLMNVNEVLSVFRFQETD